MLDAKLLKPLSCMLTTTALRASLLSGLSRKGPLAPDLNGSGFLMLKLRHTSNGD